MLFPFPLIAQNYSHSNGNPIRMGIPITNLRLYTECKGGRVWSDCGGGEECEPTCTNTMPMCPRNCYEGCYCPPDRPVWHHDNCITVDECRGSYAWL